MNSLFRGKRGAPFMTTVNSFGIIRKYKVAKVMNISKKVVKIYDKSTIFGSATYCQGF
nr:MAG TPA: hypothetical protein [Caudoviricetes sp.]